MIYKQTVLQTCPFGFSLPFAFVIVFFAGGDSGICGLRATGGQILPGEQSISNSHSFKEFISRFQTAVFVIF